MALVGGGREIIMAAIQGRGSLGGRERCWRGESEVDVIKWPWAVRYLVFIQNHRSSRQQFVTEVYHYHYVGQVMYQLS